MYLVDMYSRIEDARLFFAADKQKAKIFAQQGFVVDPESESSWRGVAPPPTFVKSDQWFREKLHDSMTLLSRYVATSGRRHDRHDVGQYFFFQAGRVIVPL